MSAIRETLVVTTKGAAVPRRMASVTPSAARLTDSLRDIGYDFSSAVADLVDNSITADATEVTSSSSSMARHRASLSPTTATG